MKYSKAVLDAAVSELASRKRSAERMADLRRKEFVKKYPDLLLIEEHMRSAASNAVMLLTSQADGSAAIKNFMKLNLDAQKQLAALYKAANVPEDYLEPQYTCPKCSDTGYCDGKTCKCKLDILKKLAYDELNRSTPISNCSFENFDLKHYPQKPVNCRAEMKKIYNYCVNYANLFPDSCDNIYMYGSTGLGKTHLSLAIARTLTDRGFSVVYTTSQKLVGNLEKEHFGKLGDDASFEEMYTDTDLLIIDDLGTEFASPFAKSALFDTINTRLLKNAPMIINSNCGPDDLRDKYDSYADRIISRLQSFECLEFSGSDYRIK